MGLQPVHWILRTQRRAQLKELTPEEQAILERGAAAQSVIQSPAISSVINELSETLTNHILSTKVDEAEKRERYYRIHVALRELVAILNQRVALKESLEAQLAEQENE